MRMAYIHSFAVYQKYLKRLGELMNFEPWQEIIISSNRVRYFWYTATLCTYSIYLSASDLLSLIISNTDKHEFSKWIGCYNDVMNHFDCVIERDLYPQKMHYYSTNIRGKSFFILKIFVVYQEKICHRCYCMGIPFIDRWNVSRIDSLNV